MLKPNSLSQTNWAQERIEELKRMYESVSGKEDEPVILMMVQSIIRLINGLSTIPSSNFFVYEKRMFWEPMRVFTDEFCKAIRAALDADNYAEKRKILEEIECAIRELSHMYQSVVNATSSPNRNIMVIPTVDTNLYEVSPKLCLYYADLLKEVAEIMKGEQENYAFLLFPSLTAETQTIELFPSLQDKNNKVVIIYIPEWIIERVDIIPIYLFHEVFHFLNKDRERARDVRSECYFLQLVGVVLDKLFAETKEILNKEQRSFLSDRWITPFVQETKKFLEACDEKDLYGRKLEQYFVEKFTEKVFEIYLDLPVIVDCLSDIQHDFANYRESTEKVYKTVNTIQKNILEIFETSMIPRSAKYLFDIYEEAYSDLMCVQTLHLTPEKYEEAFLLSASPFPGNRHDIAQRKLCVAKTTAIIWKDSEDIEERQLARRWQRFAVKQSRESMKSKVKPTISQSQKKFYVQYVQIDDQIESFYAKYFKICAQRFVLQFNNHNTEWGEFQKKLRYIQKLNTEDLLRSILSGKKSFILRRGKNDNI